MKKNVMALILTALMTVTMVQPVWAAEEEYDPFAEVETEVLETEGNAGSDTENTVMLENQLMQENL